MTKPKARAPSVPDDIHLPTADEFTHSRNMPSELRMWRAAIVLAWQDAFTATDVMIAHTEGAKSTRPIVAMTGAHFRAEARRWLTATSGAWLRSREDICHAAGVCPDRLRSRALAMIHAEADGRLTVQSVSGSRPTMALAA